MKKSTLLQMAKGFALIATALEAEGISTSDVQEAVANAKVSPKTITPTVEVVENTPEVNEEEGYTLAELEAMTLKELKEIADANEVSYGSKVKKSDLIELIMDAGEEPEEEVVEEDEPVAEEEVEGESTDEDVEGDFELTVEDLAEMNLAELKELADENEVEYPKGVKAPALRKLLEALFEEEEVVEEEPEEVVEEEEEGLTEEDLAEMSLKELKELAKEYEVEHPKVVKAEKLREILIEALWAEEEEDDAEESDETDLDATDYAEELGLNDMETEELADLLVEHDIKPKGNKQALISLVIKAIEEGVIVIEEEEGK